MDWGHHHHRGALFDHRRNFALSLYFQIYSSDLATDQFTLTLDSDSLLSEYSHFCLAISELMESRDREINLTCNPLLIRLSLYAGVVRSRWVSWSSTPVAGRVASRGGFDSHPLSPTSTQTLKVSIVISIWIEKTIRKRCFNVNKKTFRVSYYK